VFVIEDGDGLETKYCKLVQMLPRAKEGFLLEGLLLWLSDIVKLPAHKLITLERIDDPDDAMQTEAEAEAENANEELNTLETNKRKLNLYGVPEDLYYARLVLRTRDTEMGIIQLCKELKEQSEADFAPRHTTQKPQKPQKLQASTRKRRRTARSESEEESAEESEDDEEEDEKEAGEEDEDGGEEDEEGEEDEDGGEEEDEEEYTPAPTAPPGAKRPRTQRDIEIRPMNILMGVLDQYRTPASERNKPLTFGDEDDPIEQELASRALKAKDKLRTSIAALRGEPGTHSSLQGIIASLEDDVEAQEMLATWIAFLDGNVQLLRRFVEDW
jgi:hypothetical protein